MKILATIKKELLLLVRDPGGMALVFIMPLALVVVMAVIQDNTFRQFQETRIDVLLVDEDQDDLGAGIEASFQESGGIRITTREKKGGKALTRDAARKLVQSGDYQAAVIIPVGATATLMGRMDGVVRGLLARGGRDAVETPRAGDAAVRVEILFDPAIKANYRQTLSAAVERMIIGQQAEWLTAAIQEQLADGGGEPPPGIDLSRMIEVAQSDASGKEREGMALNAVQHNVPAWSMFAMFFILFPLAGNFIKEREDGSMLRLRLIAGSQLPVVVGKFLFYAAVCLLQLSLLIASGIYLMPLVGLSRLVIGTNWAGVILTGLAVAMAATGYGLLIAVYFRTPQQALSFGSISVVILAAVGGVWVPVFAMPQIMQSISPYSPLNWGLTAFNDLFLRNASTVDVLPDICKLVCFSGAAIAGSILIHKARTVS
ncbi:MAG: ABC transporter permease [bacterium]